ncbi:hypothetical protein C8R45DRAFT_1044200 [Mycena sanguinolenta]|nr:hypothetical protein C8R45DRAFT_1044200 [Mycena sanguinolenta]
MKIIQLVTLLAPFLGAVLANPSPSIIPRSSLDPLPRGCTLTLDCKGGAREVVRCERKGYGCPGNVTVVDEKCAADCPGCLISCSTGP